MVLVDTSVIIAFLKGRENAAAAKFSALLDSGIPFGINSIIYLEVLQGVRNVREFNTVKRYLGDQRFYELNDIRKSYEQAAMIYYKCRKRGITVSSTIDCLIAQTAIENDLILLHDDKDYEKIAKVASLKFL
jgi:predicted nucleic acid-binding protein